MTREFFAAWILASALILVSFGCAKKELDAIKIGAILPLTGESALIGQWGFRGLSLAEKYVNERGGIKGIPLRILVEDGLGDPKQSISAYEKLVKIEKVKIITSIISAVDLALVPLVKRDKVFFLSNAAHPDLSNVGPLVFRHSNTVQQEVALILDFLPRETQNLTLAYMNDDYSVAFKNLLVQSTKDSSLRVKLVPFEKGETDFNLIAIKIIQTTPVDYLIISGVGRNFGLLITKLKEKRYIGKIIVTLGFTVSGADRAAGEAIKGVNGVYFDIGTTSEGYREINKLHRELFKEDISIGSLLFFNSLLLIAHAFENAGPDPEKMSAFLRRTSVFEGKGERMLITNTNDVNPSLKIIGF